MKKQMDKDIARKVYRLSVELMTYQDFEYVQIRSDELEHTIRDTYEFYVGDYWDYFVTPDDIGNQPYEHPTQEMMGTLEKIAEGYYTKSRQNWVIDLKVVHDKTANKDSFQDWWHDAKDKWLSKHREWYLTRYI